MKRRNSGRNAACLVLAFLVTAPGMAQENAAREQQVQNAASRAEREAPRSGTHAEAIEVQLREAEERLAEAAAKVAELSRQRLPDMTMIGRRLRALDRPVLGVTIGSGEEQGPVEGVTVRGVTPGSAAEDAGLRSGDVLTAINDESLSAASEADANRKLLDFMGGVQEGDTLEIEYLRDGRSESVEVQPRKSDNLAFAFGDRTWQVPFAPVAPGMRWLSLHTGGSWGDMEMVSLTEDLGRYFGTGQGLLVVRAPDDDNLKLRDGDVIQRIDGREPQSVAHAMRILASYQPGETLEIEIMRDKKREVLSVEMPDHRQGFLLPLEQARPAPVVAPRARIARPAPLVVPPIETLRHPSHREMRL